MKVKHAIAITALASGLLAFEGYVLAACNNVKAAQQNPSCSGSGGCAYTGYSWLAVCVHSGGSDCLGNGTTANGTCTTYTGTCGGGSCGGTTVTGTANCSGPVFYTTGCNG
jgi:hypothetical protein